MCVNMFSISDSRKPSGRSDLTNHFHGLGQDLNFPFSVLILGDFEKYSINAMWGSII